MRGLCKRVLLGCAVALFAGRESTFAAAGDDRATMYECTSARSHASPSRRALSRVQTCVQQHASGTYEACSKSR